jgi:hypothetical protein
MMRGVTSVVAHSARSGIAALKNSFYDPARHAIRICHELYEAILLGFVTSPMSLAKATDSANAAMAFVLRKPDATDEHSFDEQRKAHVACLLYGSAPATYQPLVTKLGFDKRRKAVCISDYRTHSRAWDTLLRRAR